MSPRSPLTGDFVDRLARAPIAPHLSAEKAVPTRTIGESREGRPVTGMSFGAGPRQVSLIAGCHADEPAGPMTARALPALTEALAPNLLDRYTFHVVPDMNPDGAACNQAWYSDPPELVAYLDGAVRELPGDDIEFGFGPGETVRPECRSAMAFLRPHAPYAAHFSLHGMAFSCGAWFLICKEWAERTPDLREVLCRVCESIPFPLHDIERHGDKGFTRITPGFCTTPTTPAMARHFLALGDDPMAARFQPTSMEFIASLGGAPLCMVSELPLFRIDASSQCLEKPASVAFKEALTQARAADEDPAMDALSAQFKLVSVPFETQVRLQFAMVAAALTGLDTQG